MKPIDAAFKTKTQWYCSKEAEKWLLSFIDIIAMMVSFCMARIFILVTEGQSITQAFQSWWMEHNFTRALTYFALTLLTVAAFWAKGHYSKRRPYSNEIREVLKIILVLTLIDGALVFFGKWDFARADIIINWLLAPFILLLMRAAVKYLLINAGGWVRPMVIIGWGENALETARAFDDESLMGFRLTAFLIPDGKDKLEEGYQDRRGRPVPCIALGAEPDSTLKLLGNPHIVLALEQGGIDAFQGLIQQLSRLYQNVQIVPSLRGLPLYGVEVDHFFAHEVLLLTVRNNLARRGPQLLKRCFDLFASIALLIIGSPVLLWIAAKVLASGRPIFYGHKRVGQHGKPFPCYKFRTMAPNADKLLAELLARDPDANAEWQRDFKLKNDPRITPIGHFLRKTSLDELPQLWNVLKGEMSLVGPRPIVTAELERYGNQADYYLEAKPGITGLWQISGRNDITYETRVYLDAWYVKNWSLFNDLVILFRTLNVILKKDGAY